MARQRVEGGGAGEHFEPFGVNERVWNALEKLAVTNPAVFVDYYANPVIAKIATAWLGPNYQVTSQVNVVNPGGKAQSGHRDYHLGFLHAETIARFPEHVQRALAGAHAAGRGGAQRHAAGERPDDVPPALAEVRAGLHRDEPAGLPGVLRAAPHPAAVATGGCRVLQPGGLPRRGHEPLGRLPPHRQPAADLLGVRAGDGERRPAPGSAPRSTRRCGRRPRRPEHAVAASAEGYAFPTNLDRDAAVDGLTPPSQADLVRQALAEGWDEGKFEEALAANSRLHATH